jgi:hypothetical protein
MDEVEIDLEPEIDGYPYLLDGVRVPRVTDVLRLARKPFERFIAPTDLQWYQDRGTSGHATIEMLVKGILDKRSIPKEIKPYMPSWERTVADWGLEVLVIDGVVFSEVPMIHGIYRFGTRIDLLARSSKRRGRIGAWELKFTSTHSSATCKQTAFHLLAANDHLKRLFPDFKESVIDRFAARLTTTGKPDVKEHKDPSDVGMALSYLNVYNDRLKNNLL